LSEGLKRDQGSGGLRLEAVKHPGCNGLGEKGFTEAGVPATVKEEKLL